jgi:hypothetical protein
MSAGRNTLSRALPCPECGAAPGEPCVSRDGAPVKDARSHVRRTPIQPCGTHGGYQRHKRAGEVPCDPCLDANRRYMQEYRRKNPDKRDVDVAGLRAYNRAVRRLIDQYRSDFDALYAEEKGA